MVNLNDAGRRFHAQSPVPVGDPDQVRWDQDYDVVVVGFGGAGVCAALEAVDNKASVLAVDRFFGGGATAISGGVVYAGGGTPYQSMAGFNDTPEEMFNYLSQEVGDAVEADTLRHFCEVSANNLRWLEHYNVQFAGNVPPVKTSYPSDKYYLYYSGNEAVGSFAANARPAPRGHRAKGPGLSGASLFSPLKQSALSRGVHLQVQSEVRRLVTNAAGDVVGVEVRELPQGSWAALKHKWLSSLATRLHMYVPKQAFRIREKVRAIEERYGEVRLIRARKGVVLSAGGFVFNRDMVAHYGPKYSRGLPLGTTGCDGSGIGLGMSVGAAVDRMDKLSAWRFINPPLAWAQGVIVNAVGDRYCNEEVYGAKLGHEMCEHQDGRAILILNRQLVRQAMKQILPGKAWFFQIAPALMNMLGNAKKAASIEELASACDMPVENLVKTVEQYNAAASGRIDDPFGKSKGFLESLEEGPWYAIDVSYDSRSFPCPVITLGGLKVNEQTGQVLSDQGGVIQGLYSAGRNAVGVASNLYVSGLSIADCVYSGRRAGAHAARQKNRAAL